jgi:ABC-2 type transport system permease protein
MSSLNQSAVLAQRSVREALRTPEALIPTLLIPLFFLIVNTGQAARILKGNPFLKGQGYAAFQLPSSLLLAASFGSAALFLVEDIEGGYFDKLRATPASRTALVLGRLGAEFFKCVLITFVLLLIGLALGIRIASGPIGWVLLLLMTAGWGVVYAGFMQLIALKTRSAAATNSGGLVFFPLLFLTPGLVPRAQLLPAMRRAASLNPVTYIMEGLRSLVLDNLHMAAVLRGFAVIAVAAVLMIALNVRLVRSYD